MDDETAEALMMLLSSQSDFNMKLIKVLIAVTAALPDERKSRVADLLVELIGEHKEETDDLHKFHHLLYKGRFDGK